MSSRNIMQSARSPPITGQLPPRPVSETAVEDAEVRITAQSLFGRVVMLPTSQTDHVHRITTQRRLLLQLVPTLHCIYMLRGWLHLKERPRKRRGMEGKKKKKTHNVASIETSPGHPLICQSSVRTSSGLGKTRLSTSSFEQSPSEVDFVVVGMWSGACYKRAAGNRQAGRQAGTHAGTHAGGHAGCHACTVQMYAVPCVCPFPSNGLTEPFLPIRSLSGHPAASHAGAVCPCACSAIPFGECAVLNRCCQFATARQVLRGHPHSFDFDVSWPGADFNFKAGCSLAARWVPTTD